MIVKKMPILQGFPDFETVNFFTGKLFQKYNFTPVFYDIETTGLSRNSTYLYLIGAVGIEDETWNFYQWMAENANEEETILRIFSQFLQQCDLLISYNGDRFDQPYLEARYEKYGIPSPFTGKQSLDLYLTLKPLKSLLKLSAMKQPCMEEFLGIKDRIYDNGKECIKLYKDFLKKRNLFSGEEQILTDDIEEKVTSSITTHYKSISKVKESFESQIDELAEMFSLDRRILNEVGYKAGDSDQSILKKVYEYNADISAKHDAGIKSVMDSLKELTPSSKDFKKKLNEKVKKVTELVPQINRTELVRYISKRKVILDLMQKTLDKQLDCQQKNSKGKKINHESFLHNILFSQHSDDPLDSNLWMINDDFIHYKGISESELRNIKVENELFFREDLTKEELEELTAYNRDKLGNRPDILLFPKEHKCIIIELKSMDADVSKFVSQVSQYAGLIRQYAKDRFEITTFYAYLIGESFTLNEVKRANPFFKKAYYFDYLFCPNYPVDGGENRRDGEMYIEVIKYSTLLERAVFRNKIFTNKI